MAANCVFQGQTEAEGDLAPSNSTESLRITTTLPITSHTLSFTSSSSSSSSSSSDEHQADSSDEESNSENESEYFTPRSTNAVPGLSFGSEVEDDRIEKIVTRHRSVKRLKQLLENSKSDSPIQMTDFPTSLSNERRAKSTDALKRHVLSRLNSRRYLSRGASLLNSATKKLPRPGSVLLSSSSRVTSLNMAARLVFDALRKEKTEDFITLEQLNLFAKSWDLSACDQGTMNSVEGTNDHVLHSIDGQTSSKKEYGDEDIDFSSWEQSSRNITGNVSMKKAEKNAVEQLVAFLSKAENISDLFGNKQVVREDEFVSCVSSAFTIYHQKHIGRLLSFMTQGECGVDNVSPFCAAMFHIDRLMKSGFFLHDILSYSHKMCSLGSNVSCASSETRFSPDQIRNFWQGLKKTLQISHFRIRIFSDKSCREVLQTMILNPPLDADASDIQQIWKFVFPTESIFDHASKSEKLSRLLKAEEKAELHSLIENKRNAPSIHCLPSNFRDMSLHLRSLNLSEWRAPDLATEIARQYTIRQMRLYRCICPWEFLHSEAGQRQGLKNYARDFDMTVWYMKDAILTPDTVIERARSIKAIIEIAYAAVQPSLNNFNLAMICYLALNSGEIRKLRESWKHIKAGKNDRLRKWKLLKSLCKNSGTKLISLQRSIATGKDNKSLFTKLKFWESTTAPPGPQSFSRQRCTPFLPPILQALTLVQEDASIRKMHHEMRQGAEKTKDPLNIELMQKNLTILSPFYERLLRDEHPYPELGSVLQIQQAIAGNTRFSDKIFQSFLRNRAHCLAKFHGKPHLSQPNYKTQRFIMLENKSRERRIALYVEFALNEVCLLSTNICDPANGKGKDQNNSGPLANSNGSSVANHIFSLSLLRDQFAGADSVHISQVAVYSQRCLSICRSLYQKNGASPLLLFNLRESAELIYGSMFDQSTNHSRFDELLALWGPSAGTPKRISINSAPKDSNEQRKSLNIQIRAGIDIIHPKTRNFSQGHGMLVKMYPSWGFGTLVAQTRPHRSGTASERNPVWHVHRHNALKHFPLPLTIDKSANDLYIDIELYSRTNKRGSEKETLLGATQLHVSLLLYTQEQSGGFNTRDDNVVSAFIVPASSNTEDKNTRDTHSLTLKLTHKGSNVGQLVIDSWISPLPSCAAPTSDLEVQVYNSIVRTLLAPMQSQIEQCIELAKVGSPNVITQFRQSVLSHVVRSANQFRLRRELVSTGLKSGLDANALDSFTHKMYSEVNLSSKQDGMKPKSVYLANLSVVSSLCAQFSEGFLMDPQFNHIIADFITRRRLDYRYS